MLTINAKFVANELVPGLADGEYLIEDGSTVLDLLAACEEKCGVSIPVKNFDFMYPLFNGRPVSINKALSENGTLHLCRVVTGG